MSSYATAEEFSSRPIPKIDSFIGRRGSRGNVFCNRGGNLSLASSESSSFNTRHPHRGTVSPHIPAVPSNLTVQSDEREHATSRTVAKRYRQSLKAKIQHSLSNIPRINSNSVGSKNSIIASIEKGKTVPSEGNNDIDCEYTHSSAAEQSRIPGRRPINPRHLIKERQRRGCN